MAFRDFAKHEQGVQLLQRSLERGRLAHAYLFTGVHLGELEALARALAKTLNCRQPARGSAGVPIDACESCLSCRKIDHDNHADVFWVRPESKLRLIKIGQIVRREDSPPRVLLDVVNLKPTESEYKVGIIVAADRMNEPAANAFLKTLEEPPAQSVLILLSVEPQRLLETILSRCLRLNFGVGGEGGHSPAQLAWLGSFSQMAGVPHKSLLGRYRLMDVLLRQLTELKTSIEQTLRARSPLEQYAQADDEAEQPEPDLLEKWETELAAAIEAEYRRARSELLALVQWWLRDVWLLTLKSRTGSTDQAAAGTPAPPSTEALLHFPELPGTRQVARRLSARRALANLEVMAQLQGRLATNVQEGLALEVALLKLEL